MVLQLVGAAEEEWRADSKERVRGVTAVEGSRKVWRLKGHRQQRALQ